MSARFVRHIIVRGRVQGVGYRAFVQREALRRGVEGWVRNRKDGSVEAVLAGPADVVTALIEICRQGPFAAHVDVLDHRDGDDDALEIRRPGELFSELPTI